MGRWVCVSLKPRLTPVVSSSMLAADTGGGKELLQGVEATGNIGGQRHGDAAAYAPRIARVCSYVNELWMVAGEGILDAQTDFS